MLGKAQRAYNRIPGKSLRGRQSLPNSRSNSVRENYFRELKRFNTRRRYVLMSQAKHEQLSLRLTIVGSVYTGLFYFESWIGSTDVDA